MYVVCPVPPYILPIAVPFQVPVAIVPNVVIVFCPTYEAEIWISFAFTVIPEPAIAFIVLPVFVKPVPALIWPAPENCENVKSVEPKVGVPLCVAT